jgi:hypothetical protein
MIRCLLLGGAAALASCVFPLRASAADAPTPAEVRTQECLLAAAEAHRLPAAMLMVLLKVEGGRLGHVSQNDNDTLDIGPMQVNTIWVTKIAARWRTTPAAAFLALRDNLCANLEGGAWILARALAEAKDDFWGGVAIYHSHKPEHQGRYLRLVLAATRRLQDQAGHAPPATAPVAAAPARVASRG